MRQQDRAGAALAAATGLGVTLIGLAAGLLGLRIGGLTPAGALAVSALEAWLASALLAAGSVQTRRIACGSPTCRCHHDPDARHGPYHYWTRKARGKTVGLKLTEDELGLYREWIENNRELERLVKEMRRVSSRVLALITGRQAP